MHGAYQRTWSSDTQNVISGMASGLNLDKIAFNLRYSSDRVSRSNPWPRSLLNGDFILIAEFAENEGPKPVMTIPQNAGENFDVNAFALHVMSVDYTQSRGSNFSIVEDTQLFLTERKDGIYAYVHHFTLYDIHARGFVRPYCMCYISHCKRKMFSFLDSFMDEFTKVSQLFRHGNRITFLRDLEERLCDVLLLKEKSILENSFSNSLVGQRWKVSQVAGKSKKNMNVEYELIVTETKKLIEVLRPHIGNDPRVEHQLKRLEDLVDGRTRSFTDAEGFRMVKHELSDHKLPTQKPTLRKAISLPDIKDLLKGYKELNLKLRSCLPSYLNSMKQLRHLHDLCEWGAKEGLNRLRCVFKHYSRETAALLIEKTETSHLDRFPSLLTIGRSVVCNVLRNIDVKCVSSRRTSRSFIDPPSQECLTRKSSCGSLESMHSLDSFQSCVEEEFLGSSKSSDGPLSPFSPSCSFHADLQGGEKNEFNSYSTSESLRSDGSDAMSTHSDTTLRRVTAETVSLSDYALMGDESSSNLSGSPLSRTTSVTPETNVGMHFSQFRGKSVSLESLSTSSDSKGHLKRPRKNLDVPVLQGQNLSPLKTEKVPIVSIPDVSSRNASTKSNLFGKNAIRRVKSLDTSQTSSCSGEEKLLQRRSRYNARPEMVRLRCFAEEVSQPLASYTGSNLILLRNHLSFGIHLLYALLCGRPVVVFAEPRNERDARIVISALWMFVPENMSHGKVVDPWRTKPLQIADLAWLKLVGLAKSKHFNMIPKSVKGCYIRPMCNINNTWPSNAALVAFVHSVFLELANKAYVYYFASCLGGLQWCCCKSDQQSQSGQAIVDVDGSEVLSRLRVHFSDAKIVQYFSELIKQQQIDYFNNLSADQDFVGERTLTPESDSASERRSLLICTDPSKCVVFHNVKSQEST
ncbi:Smith-Magenis syndrome chromosomal region candidate gene 8 protein-like [Stylophora pistillata]|uniref:Smith-Magenis syndrome chromosomal region candidate gene 8 protein-like n=1 Tax=Stylophora pistillata TaxID=50429 RepID=A0A2B4SYW3_STYPI|nr:Smith-Magenis syndrome chromosomal region candidate gene 8 protein-like [Stylophora pistillata]